MHGRILFAGGTGFAGRTVTHYLIDAGFRVRILSRHPERTLKTAPRGSEIIFGDVTRPDTLPEAFDGCRFLVIALSGQTEPAQFFAVEDDGVTNLARAAADAGIERIAMVSGAAVDGDHMEYFVRAKYLGEQTLLEQEIPASVFRSSWFMESLPRMVTGPVAAIPGPQPHPVHFVAVADLAAMIVRSFELSPPPAGVFYAYGPEAMIVEEALRQYCHVLARGRMIVHIPFGTISLGASIAGDRLRFLYDLLRFLNDVPEPPDYNPETTRVFGLNPTTLDKWLTARKNS